MEIIGARYVPKLVGPWNASTAYEALSIVTDSVGNSFTSKIPVPAGRPLSDRRYWVQTATFSAQIVGLFDSIADINDEIERLDDAVTDAADSAAAALSAATGAADSAAELADDLAAGEYSTPAVYPSPRNSALIYDQTDFNDFIAGFRKGFTSKNARIMASGTYTFLDSGDAYLVFNGAQMHIAIEAGVSAVIDLNGMTYYNGHFVLNPDEGASCEVIDSMPTGRHAYFEDSSFFATKCIFNTTLRLWGGWGYITDCEWQGYDAGSCVDVIGGSCTIAGSGEANGTYFNLISMEANDALLGIGNGGRVRFAGRISYSRPANGQYFVRGRQNGGGLIYYDASARDPVNDTGYSAAVSRDSAPKRSVFIISAKKISGRFIS